MNLLITVLLINLVQHTSTYCIIGKHGKQICDDSPSLQWNATDRNEDLPLYDDMNQNNGPKDILDDTRRQKEENRNVLVLVSQSVYNKMAKKAFDKYVKDKSDGKPKLFIPMEALYGAKVLFNTIQKKNVNNL